MSYQFSNVSFHSYRSYDHTFVYCCTIFRAFFAVFGVNSNQNWLQGVMCTSLHVSPQLAFSSILIGFETTANEFNKQKLVSHLERQEAAKHDPEF